jgi:UDP-glucose 4-epimerase
MKLLVTGGAGYIGSIVSRQLIGSGHEVVVLDNLERGHRAAVAPEARLAEVDLLEAMRAAQVRRLVFSSTCAVYGQPDEVPIAETAPPRPANAYGASKLAVDGMISDYCLAHGLGAVSLRYFNVAGAAGEIGEDHEPETHIIPNVLRTAMGEREHVEVFGTDYPTPDGTAIRDYIHIEDLSNAHVLALASAREGTHAIYNLGTGNGFSVREVIETAREVTGHVIPVLESPRRPGDPPRLVAAAARIHEALGWEPTKNLRDMVADAWAFHQAHPHGYGAQ